MPSRSDTRPRWWRSRLTTLILPALLASGAAAPAPADAAVPFGALEAESLSLPAAAGLAVSGPAASGGAELLIWSSATASGQLATAVPARLQVRARGDQCAGAPRMNVVLGGSRLLGTEVRTTTWATHTAATVVPAGTHRISVAFANDHRSDACDRNLRVDRLALVPTDPNPLAGRRLDVDPLSTAAQQVAAWWNTRPADARQLEKIASRPQSTWFGEWSGDVRAAVARRVAEATGRGATPLLVAYNVPGRDCGSHSAGGAGSADAYRAWVRGFAAGIGSAPAVVVLEPDALAQLDCLSGEEQRVRLGLLEDAIGVLSAPPQTVLYVDAGHSGWVAAEEMARRLRAAGAGRARGVALNVSNFRATSAEAAYARALAAILPGTRAVIDTSRNGLGPAPGGEWCNPAGRALGAAPGAVADGPVDAQVWIKRPGESDGECGGGPAAGTWWPSYALGLAQRAGA